MDWEWMKWEIDRKKIKVSCVQLFVLLLYSARFAERLIHYSRYTHTILWFISAEPNKQTDFFYLCVEKRAITHIYIYKCIFDLLLICVELLALRIAPQ